MSGGLDFYLKIARLHYNAMEKIANNLPVFQLDHEKAYAANDCIFTDNGTSIDSRLRASQLSGWWRQIFFAYDAAYTSITEALGYYEIRESFADDEKKNGMIINFASRFENYLFKLFAIVDKLGQLSNIYHNINMKEKDVTMVKIQKEWELRKIPEDEFIAAFKQHYVNAKIFEKMKTWRNSLTHGNELAIGHCGFPCAHPLKEKGKKGLTYGGYERELDPEEVKAAAIESFNEMTELLKKIDIVICKEWKDLVGV
ncbi:MAG: Cthe_2314 family HEPN domain-containing protein [Vulcanimicrobiota bacterium]